MKSRELKQVGQVAIDSGRIAIIDELHVSPELPANCFHAQHTSHGDGWLPVYSFSYEGHEYLAIRISRFTADQWQEMFSGSSAEASG